MQCPKCAIPLNMAERCGIEIDYCPQCRGVWLDRGELDKIIERSSLPLSQAPNAAVRPHEHPTGQPMNASRHYDGQRGHGYHKKKSFFGELFDFD